MAKRRKDYNDVITLHRPAPPCRLDPSTSGEEPLNVKNVTRKSTRVPHPGTEADKAYTLSPCSVKQLQLQDQFLSECQEADAIVQPLLDAENGFVKDLDRVINRKDLLRMKKRQLLNNRWVEHVWQPLQLRVLKHVEENMALKRRIAVGAKVSTAPLKKPHFICQCLKMREKRADLHNQTGFTRAYSPHDPPKRSRRDLPRSSRGLGPVYMATEDGRCYRPGCLSAIGLSHSSSVKP